MQAVLSHVTVHATISDALPKQAQTEAGAAAVLNTDTVREGSLYCADGVETV